MVKPESRYKIKNWRKFQHFKDRKPPWIKLYRDILDDIRWHELDPFGAKNLIMLWLIASEYGGTLPEAKTLCFRLRLNPNQLESVFYKLSHWIEPIDTAEISTRHQEATPETERETETELETEAEAASPPKRGTQLPDDFELTMTRHQFAVNHGVHPLHEFNQFLDYHKSKGSVFKDWDAAWRTWVRNAVKFSKGGTNGKRDAARIEAGIGSGPELPTKYCANCGRTKAYHARPINNILREDANWKQHDFTPELDGAGAESGNQKGLALHDHAGRAGG